MTEQLVYLDTNILSRIPDLRVSPATAEAYGKLACLGGIRLVTSEKTRAEILQTNNPERNGVLQFLTALVEKVPCNVVHYSGVLRGAPVRATPLRGDWTDPLFDSLKRIFDSDDAEHIVQAVRAGCQFFLTLDETSILSRAITHAADLSTLCPSISFVSPTHLVSVLEGQRRNG